MKTKLPRAIRKVVGIFTMGVTKRGNPQTYFYILECGHFAVGGSSKRASSFDQFMLTQGLTVNKSCSSCVRGEPPHIPDFTPWYAMEGLSDDILEQIVKALPTKSKGANK